MLDTAISLITTVMILSLLVLAVVTVNALTKTRDTEDGRRRNDVRLNSTIRGIRWFALATAASTITPLYTIFTAFGLNSTHFGLLLFASPLTLLAAGFIARHISNGLLQRAADQGRSPPVLSTGLMGSVIGNCRDSTIATLARLVGIANVVIIVWLEVKYLAIYISQYLYAQAGSPPLPVIGLVAAVIVGALSLFVMRYGMNGVIVSDCIYWPITLVSCGFLAIWLLFNALDNGGLAAFHHSPLLNPPEVSTLALLGFIFNITVTNIAILSVRDEHWIRVVAFSSEKDVRPNLMIDSLPKACAQAAALWSLLIVVGSVLLPAYSATSGNQGPHSGFSALLPLANSAPTIFALIVAGLVAIALSTLDSQFFTLRQLLSYDVVRNRVTANSVNGLRQIRNAMIAGVIAFTLVYCALAFKVDDFSILFVLYPLPIVLLPATLRRYLTGREVRPMDVITPLILYLVLTLIGVGIYLASGKAPMEIFFWAAPLAVVLGLPFALFDGRPSSVLKEARTLANAAEAMQK